MKLKMRLRDVLAELPKCIPEALAIVEDHLRVFGQLVEAVADLEHAVGLPTVGEEAVGAFIFLQVHRCPYMLS